GADEHDGSGRVESGEIGGRERGRELEERHGAGGEGGRGRLERGEVGGGADRDEQSLDRRVGEAGGGEFLRGLGERGDGGEANDDARRKLGAERDGGGKLERGDVALRV